MAKAKTRYVCSNCGYISASFLGRCPQCGAWNTLIEETVTPVSAASQPRVARSGAAIKPTKLNDVTAERETRVTTKLKELNRVLGGGIVPGSLVLIGGDPGIGKSTLLLQVSGYLANNHGTVLYVSGEESASQIKMRADRLNVGDSGMYLYPETDMPSILQAVDDLKPDYLVIDSVQTMNVPDMNSAVGSVAQIREVTAELMRLAKGKGVTTFIVGHVTKEGAIAGPKILEHMVDTVLHFEGDQQHMYRILRSMKNRFGSTSEIGIYEMLQAGLRQVTNPSELLLSNHGEDLSGIAVAATVEGVRPILLEVQALVSTAAYGTPQRSATGFDARRLNMLLAVLEKRVGFRLGSKDVFLNIAGGIRVNDPALDLGVVMAVLSSNIDVALPEGVVFAGEVGLSGEIRAVSRIEQRVSEAEKLGFNQIYIPLGNKKSYLKSPSRIKVQFVSQITEICRSLFG